MLIRNQRTFVAGAFFIAVAVFYFVMSLGYEYGTPVRMGPGLFPAIVSTGLGIIGAWMILSSLRANAGITILRQWNWKGLIWIAGSVVLFGALLKPLGFVLTLVVVVLVASRASQEFTWRGAIASAAVLVAMSVGIFVYGIDLLLPLWPQGLR